MNDFVSLEQACELLNRSPAMIDIYIRKGLLTKYKKLGQPLFKKSEVEDLLIPKPVSETQT
jgi:hypothetical protein